MPSSLAAFEVTCLLIVAGLVGSRDPLANPLPLFVWTVWWVGLTLLHAVFGNLWAWLNPWTGPMHLAAAHQRRAARRRASSPGRSWLGYAPAIAIFLGFGWLELVYPAPDDPDAAGVGGGGLLAGDAGGDAGVRGDGNGSQRGEPFAIFFRLVAGLSPFVVERDADSRPRPGAGMARRAARGRHPPLPLSGALFVLLTLSTVSFDGVSRTFRWLALWGINPLEFPGRSAVMAINTLGMLGAFVAS